MLRKAWQSGLIQFVAVLSAIAWGFIFLGEWRETVPDAAQTWFSAHWWQIGLVVISIWIIRIRERNVWARGYKDGRVDHAKWVSKETNRVKMAVKMKADGGYLPFNR